MTLIPSGLLADHKPRELVYLTPANGGYQVRPSSKGAGDYGWASDHAGAVAMARAIAGADCVIFERRH